MPDVIESCRRQTIHCHQEAVSLDDITDGSLYKLVSATALNDGDRNAYHVTIMLNTDGAPVFKSQNFSIWPLYASILELSVNRR